MMPLLRCNSLPAMFLERAAACADAPLLHWRDGRGRRANLDHARSVRDALYAITSAGAR